VKLTKEQKINYYRCVADDYTRMWAFYYQCIYPNKNFYYLNLHSSAGSHKEFRKIWKKFRENYLRHAGHIVCGVVEHQFDHVNYHAHLVLIPVSDILPIQRRKLDIEIKDNWQKAGGCSKRLFLPQPKREGNGPLGMLFYMCKAGKYGQRTKTMNQSTSNILHCNLGSLPWKEVTLPSSKFHRPNLPKMVAEFFKQNRADPEKGEIAKMPCLVSWIENFKNLNS
jgi:hypothetical protein